MSSKVNHALFDLVQAMTKSEKRYFKLMSTRHTIGEENNYVRIFDYIERQTGYDEDKLFDYFKNEPFLNRFSITKKRLYDHILSSLDSFHSVNSIDAQLHKSLHSASILYEKSLYDQCRRMLISAEKLAEKHERIEILLEVYALQQKLIETMGYVALSEEELANLTAKEKKCLKEVNVKSNLWSIKSNLFRRLSLKGVARNQEDVEAYKAICSEILNDLRTEELTVASVYLYYHIKSAYFYAIQNLDESLKYLQLNLEWLKSKKSIFQIEPNKQFSVLTNAIFIADKTGNPKLANQLLNELKLFAQSFEPNEDLEIKLFSSISSIELSMCLRMGDFERAGIIAETVVEKLTFYGDKISPQRRAFLDFKLAVVYIGKGEFNLALKRINKILNDSNLDTSEDIIGFTQLLDLLVHIELHHDKLLPYTLKSTQRFFKSRNRLYSFEKVFLHFIAKLIKCEDRFEVESLWEGLYNELTLITHEDNFESIAMEYFDFQSWAESKLKRKPFDLVVKEKYNQPRKAAS